MKPTTGFLKSCYIELAVLAEAVLLIVISLTDIPLAVSAHVFADSGSAYIAGL